MWVSKLELDGRIERGHKRVCEGVKSGQVAHLLWELHQHGAVR